MHALTTTAGLASLWIALAFSAGACAEEQKIATLDIQLEGFLRSHKGARTGRIPISVITDSENNILGFRVAKDGGSSIKAADETEKEGLWVYSAYLPLEKLKAKTFEVKIQSNVLPNTLLLRVDGTKINPRTGGTFRLQYANSPIFGGLNSLDLELRRSDEGVWSAFRPGSDQPIESAVVRNAYLLTFKEPQVVTLDPAELLRTRSGAEDSARDPRVATQLDKYRAMSVERYEGKPLEIFPGTSVLVGPAR